MSPFRNVSSNIVSIYPTNLAVSGVVGNEVAFVEQGVKFGAK